MLIISISFGFQDLWLRYEYLGSFKLQWSSHENVIFFCNLGINCKRESSDFSIAKFTLWLHMTLKSWSSWLYLLRAKIRGSCVPLCSDYMAMGLQPGFVHARNECCQVSHTSSSILWILSIFYPTTILQIFS